MLVKTKFIAHISMNNKFKGSIGEKESGGKI